MASDYAVLLHGIGRNAAFQASLGAFLKGSGFRVINESYPSKRLPIREIARTHIADLIERQCTDHGSRIHFVTHSMGGLVLRAYLQENRPPNLGRVVMLAPPNQGSELAASLCRLGLYRWWMGPAGSEVSSGPEGIHHSLPPADFETGILIGNRSQSLVCNGFFPGPNDGRVSLARARLEGMAEFIVMSETHDSVTSSPTVYRAVLRFLETGSFHPALHGSLA